MTSTELAAQDSADVDSSEFDLAVVNAVDTTDKAAVAEFLDRCAADIQANVSVIEGAHRLVTIAAASATHVAIQAGRIPASGRAGEGQLDNAQWSRFLTGRDVAPSEVSRWRNVARAVFTLGITPDATPDLYKEIANKTPKGLTKALDKAEAALGDKRSKTAIAKAHKSVVSALKEAAGDNGGSNTRTSHDPQVPEKMTDQAILATMHDRLASYETAFGDAETDEARDKAHASLASLSGYAKALFEACEAATRRMDEVRKEAKAKADAEADEATLAESA